MYAASIIEDSADHLYRSDNRLDWERIQLPTDKNSISIDKLEFINETWILRVCHEKSFYYSQDALTWQKSQLPRLPDRGVWGHKELLYFNDLWVWRCDGRAKYSYDKEGLIFDSVETSSYRISQFYCAHRLDGAWEPWDKTPSLDEGVEIQSVHALPGTQCLLAFCDYDSSYVRNKKKHNAQPFVRYHIPGKNWRSCTWDCALDRIYRDILVMRIEDKLMCFSSGNVLASDKGYAWELWHENIHVDSAFPCGSLGIIFTREHSYETVYFSQDAKTFQDLMLGEGSWRYFTANTQGALSIYSPDDHETFLRIGHFITTPVSDG